VADACAAPLCRTRRQLGTPTDDILDAISIMSRLTAGRGQRAQCQRWSLLKKRWRASVGIEKAHFTPKHIDELRQAIDTAALQELTDLTCLARPDRDGPVWVMHNGAELQHLETASPASDAALPLKNGTRSLPLDRQRNKNQQRSSNYQYAPAIRTSAKRLI